MKYLLVIAAAVALGLGGYALASWLTAPPDPVKLEADHGIAQLEQYLWCELARDD